MGRPPKSQLTIITEGKSHRTKEELETRKKGEEKMQSRKKMKCRFKKTENPTAYTEFRRIAGLLDTVDKNDALYEAVVNRYCQIYSECLNFEKQAEGLAAALEKLEVALEDGELEIVEYLKRLTEMQGQALTLDKQLMNKRKMLLDIEKENIMTIASSLRAVPKTPDKTPEKDDPIAQLRRSRGG